jgi:hypothetical protein
MGFFPLILACGLEVLNRNEIFVFRINFNLLFSKLERLMVSEIICLPSTSPKAIKRCMLKINRSLEN